LLCEGMVCSMLLKGTPLSKKDFDEGKVITSFQKPKMEYRWDTGEAMGKYLAGLKAGKLLGVHCQGCKRTMIPPRMFCEQCFKPIHEWVELKDSGMINTFSICYVTWDMQRVTDPLLPAVIEIDGASPGMGILHHLGEFEDPKQIKIGMRVKAVWKPEKERQGAITDLRYFKPM